MAAEIIIAGISATMEAIELWLSVRDRLRARRVFVDSYQRITPSQRLEARQLESLVPPDVLDSMKERVERCWERYSKVLKDEQGYLPDEVDSATQAVQRCICRELQRLLELNREIPPGTLKRWWDAYCEPRHPRNNESK